MVGAMRESDTESQAADVHRTKIFEMHGEYNTRPFTHHLYQFISIYRLVVILVDLISLFVNNLRWT